MTHNTPNTQSPIPNTQYPIRNSQFAIRNLSLLLPLSLALLILLPALFGVPFSSSDAAYTDLLISHYPNALYLKQSILEGHTIPLWSPAILSGYHFAANPLAGLWYPPGWAVLLLPLPLGFTLLIALHLIWGGLGLYRLLRAEGLCHSPALFGALAFELMPKLFAHYGAGHLTLLYAIPWTPWLLLSLTRRKSDSPLLAGERPGERSAWASALILALIFLADPRWAAYAGLLWLGYLFAYSQYDTMSLRAFFAWQSPSPQEEIASAEKRRLAMTIIRPLLDKIPHVATSLAITALLSAPLLLPLLEYVSHSTRSHLAPAEVFSHSLPPAQLLGLLFPSGGASAEWAFYAGGVGLILTLIALTNAKIRKKSRFWLLTAGLSLVFALGSHFPGLELLARLPGLSLLRVPPRTLFLLGMALASVSAHTLGDLLSGHNLTRAARLSLMGLVAFVLLLGGGIWALAGELSLTVAWGVGAITLAALWVGLARGRLSPQAWMTGLLLLGLIDWGGAAFQSFSIRPTEEALAPQSGLVEYLVGEPGRFRIYSPSYSIPQHLAAQHGIELADGVDPLQITAYAQFMEAATGVPQDGYSVTLPPFPGGDPSHDNAACLPDPKLLGLLNVRYIAAEFDLPVEGLVFLKQFGETRLYDNEFAMPRAWMQPLDAAPGLEASPAEIVSWEPNHVTINASGPGLLVLSEIAYPGWRVKVDGQKAEIETVAGILRGVELSEGNHQIEFLFRPLSVYIGLAVFAVGLGFVLNARRGEVETQGKNKKLKR